ncbi:MFS transporter [Cohnella sp. REN36]|uniref:MFS transporter n=1 Tax=Cohnella sp. REN36 TaxID=2887347 RepID=UPI001D141CD0|nr:MFS transporter [Cohnella sp. REN36]MCC3371731.1 MFS transporter [Cohnella sp. REN36]
MLSNHFWVLLAARIVQAVGAGAAFSLSIVLLTRYVPLARRGKSMTFIMSSVSLGFGLGPVIGGLVVQYVGWRYLCAITSGQLFSNHKASSMNKSMLPARFCVLRIKKSAIAALSRFFLCSSYPVRPYSDSPLRPRSHSPEMPGVVI